MFNSSSDTHKSLLPSRFCCRTLFCPRTSVSPRAGSVAMRAFELTIPVWETWSFFQSVILMTLSFTEKMEREKQQESRRCSAGAPARWVKITIPFAERAIFNEKLFCQVFFFFCPALFCEFLVPFLYAPALPCGLACCLPSESWSYAWWTQCIADMQGGVTSREREQADKCFLMGCGNWDWGIFILQCPGGSVQAFPGKMANG